MEQIKNLGIKRLDYIDWYEGLGVLLIVLHHVFQYFPVMKGVVNYVTCFHVTCFFLASGYIYGKKEIIDVTGFLKRKAMTLLIPYVVFSIINAGLKLGVLGVLGRLTTDICKDELVQLLITGNGTVWFLSTLFLVELLFFLSIKFKWHKIIVLGIMTFSLVFSYIGSSWENPIIVVLKRSMLGFFFFMVAYCGARLMDRINLVVAIVMIVLGSIVSQLTYAKIEYMGGTFYNMIPAVLVNICIPVGLFAILKIGSEQQNIWAKMLNIFTYFGKNSLQLMLIHPIVLLFFSYPFGSRIVAWTTLQQIVIACGVFCVVIAISVVVICTLKKYCAWMFGVRY